VVDAFSRVYRDIAPQALPQPKLDALLATIRGAAAAASPAAVAPAAASAGTPRELLAFVSLARVATGTPTVEDIGALADGFLRQLAPAATVALFGYDAAGDRLCARYASGPGAATVAGLTLRLGERLTGWVGANLRGMADGDARLDLQERTPADLRAACATPLVAEGTLAGVLTIYSAEPLTAAEARTVEMIAPHLATALAAATVAGGRAADPGRLTRSGMRIVARR
jgi:GAF domain-containing protein